MIGAQESPLPPPGAPCEGSQTDTKGSGWPITGTVNPAMRVSRAARRQCPERVPIAFLAPWVEFAFIRFPYLYVCDRSITVLASTRCPESCQQIKARNPM